MKELQPTDSQVLKITCGILVNNYVNIRPYNREVALAHMRTLVSILQLVAPRSRNRLRDYISREFQDARERRLA